MKKILRVILRIFLLCIFIHISVTVIDGLCDEIKKTDVGIILGNKVDLNGKPSERLQRRLDKAVELYNKNYFNYVIVSGGIGKEGFDEASVMKDYLVKAGIPAEIIIEDNKGNNTKMTAINSKTIMDIRNIQSATVITQYYHITRTKLAMHKAGVENVYSAHANIFEVRDIYSLIREFFGYYKYLLDGKFDSVSENRPLTRTLTRRWKI